MPYRWDPDDRLEFMQGEHDRDRDHDERLDGGARFDPSHWGTLPACSICGRSVEAQPDCAICGDHEDMAA